MKDVCVEEMMQGGLAKDAESSEPIQRLPAKKKNDSQQNDNMQSYFVHLSISLTFKFLCAVNIPFVAL